VGDKEFIAKARHWRYVIGGAMCQAGCFAAAGLVALDTMVERLTEDHANAKRLAAALMDLGINVSPPEIETNILFMDVPKFVNGTKFVQLLRDQGVLVNPPRKGCIRFVTHYGVTRDDIEKTVLQVSKILKSMRVARVTFKV
jgi:threonine aldolase